MAPDLTVRIWRGGKDQSRGAFSLYDVPRQASQTVLDVVTYVQGHLRADACLPLLVSRRHVRLVRDDGERRRVLALPHARRESRAWTLVNDVRDTTQRDRMRAIAGDAGCHACHTQGAAALAREDSRGAHYREDHPGSDDLCRSTFTVARRLGDGLKIVREPVRFTRVRPGETLIAAREGAQGRPSG